MRVLITAGPTREPIDDVRFISNRSSGQMGFALAEAASAAGHEVTLLLGPVLLPPSVAERVNVIRFNTTADLEALLAEHFPKSDVLIKAAAVAPSMALCNGVPLNSSESRTSAAGRRSPSS